MNAVLFDNKIIGYGDPTEAVHYYLGCNKHGQHQLVTSEYVPKSCATLPLGTIILVSGAYYRVVEKEVAGWVSGPQLKRRAEIIGEARCYPTLDPEAANIHAFKTAHMAEVDRLNNIITCLNNTLNSAHSEADKLREELNRESAYSEKLDEKCEKLLKSLISATTTKQAIGIFNKI